VTGASDDDPSGIATYSQVGAQFGFAMLWTMLFSYPLMAGIQEISAWIGRVTGMGIAANIRRHATLLGVAMNFTSLNPIKALFWSAVINGVVAVPVMVVMMLMTGNPRVTGKLRLSSPQKIISWAATVVMSLVTVGMIATWNS
jgi:Mn2+/Fe2+ NRAMP family transporter